MKQMNRVKSATEKRVFKAPLGVEVLAEGLAFPEGPAFAADGSLWAVELKGGALVQLKDDKLIRHHVGGAPNGIAIDAKDRIWFCDAMENAIRRFNPSTKELKVMADEVDGSPLDKPNDLAFDSKGNLLFTCPGKSRQEPTGYVCVLTKDGNVKKITTEKYFPNGLAFTDDGTSLIIAETYKHRLWKGDWNFDTCEWTNGKVWCNVDGPNGLGGPDGMAFDNEGNLYVAVFGTGKIKVVSKEGKVVEEILLPGQNPTNCAFDPIGTLGLVVTEAEKGLLLSLEGIAIGMELFNANNENNFLNIIKK